MTVVKTAKQDSFNKSPSFLHDEVHATFAGGCRNPGLYALPLNLDLRLFGPGHLPTKGLGRHYISVRGPMFKN